MATPWLRAIAATVAMSGMSPPDHTLRIKVRAFVDHLARSSGRPPYWDEKP